MTIALIIGGIIAALALVCALFVAFDENDPGAFFLGLLVAAFIMFIAWIIGDSVEESIEANNERESQAKKVGLELIEETSDYEDLWIAKKGEHFCIAQYVEAKNTFDVFVCESEGN